MVAAITARTGAGSVVKAKTACHIEVSGAEANIGDTARSAITSSSVANPSVITSTAHGLVSGESVIISGHTGSTPDINGEHIVTVTGANTFTIPVNVTVGGTGGFAEKSEGVSGEDVGTEKRYYLLVDAPVGVDDARSHVFQTSSDGKHVWDDYIFPAAGNYTIRLRDMLDDSDVATLAVTVDAA